MVLPSAAVAAAGLIVLAVQAAQLGELMDRERSLSAGHAAPLVFGYAAAVAAIGLGCAALPRRLLWLPPATAAALAGSALLATLTAGGEAWSFLVALAAMGACWRVGAWTLTAVRAPALAAMPPAAWLAGAGVLGVAIALIGRAGAARWWTVGVPLLALGAAALPRGWRALRAGVAAARGAGPLEAVAVSVIALAVGVAAIYAAAPELAFDSLHLKAWLPSEWARTGTIDARPENPLANVTGLLQVLAVPGHLVGAEGIGRYLQLLALPAAAGSVWWLARESWWAPAAGVAVAATPHVLWQATTAYDDLLLLLAAVGLAGAVAALARAEAPGDAGAAVAVGLLAGAAVGLKVHLAPLALGLAGGWVLLRRGGRPRVALATAGGAAALAGPPLVLRWIDVGNPVLPAYNDVFGSELWPPVDDRLIYPYGDPGALGPLDVVASSATGVSDFAEGAPAGAFGPLVAAVVVAMLVLWVRGRRDRGTLLLWAATILSAVAWYVQFRNLRFLLPVGGVALLALALAAPVGAPRRGGALLRSPRSARAPPSSCRPRWRTSGTCRTGSLPCVPRSLARATASTSAGPGSSAMPWRHSTGSRRRARSRWAGPTSACGYTTVGPRPTRSSSPDGSPRPPVNTVARCSSACARWGSSGRSRAPTGPSAASGRRSPGPPWTRSSRATARSCGPMACW